jgi:hypothetical protein
VVDRYAYVARFDVAAYEESMDYGLLLKLLNQAGIKCDLKTIALRAVLHQRGDTQTDRGNVDRQTFDVCDLAHCFNFVTQIKKKAGIRAFQILGVSTYPYAP